MPSSPKGGASDLVRAAPVGDVADLMTAVGRVRDPRDPRGVRYRLGAVLAVAVCAVLGGARSFAAIGEFAADLTAGQLARLGLDAAPVESTMRKLFARPTPPPWTHSWRCSPAAPSVTSAGGGLSQSTARPCEGPGRDHCCAASDRCPRPCQRSRRGPHGGRGQDKRVPRSNRPAGRVRPC